MSAGLRFIISRAVDLGRALPNISKKTNISPAKTNISPAMFFYLGQFFFMWLPSLKVWSTVKIRRTRVPQKAIVPVGRPSPYSIIILVSYPKPH